MTLFLFLYPQQTVHSFPLILPFSHESRTRRNGPQPSFDNSILVHAYWYWYCWRTLADLDDPPRTPHTNSGASSSPHSHDGLCNGPGSKEPRRRSPSSSNRGTDTSSVQLSPSEELLHRFLMSCAERSPLLSRTLASNNLLTSFGFKKTSHLPAEET